MLFCRLLIFLSKLTVSKISFTNIIRVSNGLDPDFVGPDLVPKLLDTQMVLPKEFFEKLILKSSADDKNHEKLPSMESHK